MFTIKIEHAGVITLRNIKASKVNEICISTEGASLIIRDDYNEKSYVFKRTDTTTDIRFTVYLNGRVLEIKTIK